MYIINLSKKPLLVGHSLFVLGETFFRYCKQSPPILDVLYLFMKRFRTQPSEVLGMKRAWRLELYKRELEMVEKEVEEYEKSKSK